MAQDALKRGLEVLGVMRRVAKQFEDTPLKSIVSDDRSYDLVRAGPGSLCAPRLLRPVPPSVEGTRGLADEPPSRRALLRPPRVRAAARSRHPRP